MKTPKNESVVKLYKLTPRTYCIKNPIIISSKLDYIRIILNTYKLFEIFFQKYTSLFVFSRVGEFVPFLLNVSLSKNKLF